MSAISYDVIGAAAQSGVSQDVIRDACRTGQCKARKNGRKYVILHEDLIEYVRNLPLAGSAA